MRLDRMLPIVAAGLLVAYGDEGPNSPTRAEVGRCSWFRQIRDPDVALGGADQALPQGSTDVRMSVDSAPPRTIKGFAGTTSTGGKVLLTIAQDSFLAWLNGHRHASVTYADGAGSYKTTAEFPIGGIEQHRVSFLAACGKRGEKTR